MSSIVAVIDFGGCEFSFIVDVATNTVDDMFESNIGSISVSDDDVGGTLETALVVVVKWGLGDAADISPVEVVEEGLNCAIIPDCDFSFK